MNVLIRGGNDMNPKLGAFIIAIFAILAIVRTVQIFRRNKLSTRLLLMWLSIWFAIGFFALFPSVLDKLRKFFNMGYRPFFITTAAILLLYVIIFYVTSGMSRINRKISKLTQEIAILNYKLGEKTNKNINLRENKKNED